MRRPLNPDQSAALGTLAAIVLTGQFLACYKIGFAWGFLISMTLYIIDRGLNEVKKSLDRISLTLTLVARPRMGAPAGVANGAEERADAREP